MRSVIDADASGWTFGVLGERLLDEKTRTRVTAGFSYGSYLFDGSCGSASATSAGWAPGKVDFNGADVDSFYLGCGAVYQITANIRAAIGYRADIRSGSEPQQELRLSSSWRF